MGTTENGVESIGGVQYCCDAVDFSLALLDDKLKVIQFNNFQVCLLCTQQRASCMHTRMLQNGDVPAAPCVVD